MTEHRIKYAVFDGTYWDGKGEVSLYWGDEDGNCLEEIKWPKDWPNYVDCKFLRARGFIVKTT